MTSCKNVVVKAVAVTGILLYSQLLGSKTAFGQEAEYTFPPATPVTCRTPQSQNIYKSAESFYMKGRGKDIDEYMQRLTHLNSRWRAWAKGCGKLCKHEEPLPPQGGGWLYLGQYSGSQCGDTWVKIINKDKNRIGFYIKTTSRWGDPDPEIAHRLKIIKCDTRSYWGEFLAGDKKGWNPIKPFTAFDDVVNKFC